MKDDHLFALLLHFFSLICLVSFSSVRVEAEELQVPAGKLSQYVINGFKVN